MKMVLMITMILMTTSGAFDENMRCWREVGADADPDNNVTCWRHPTSLLHHGDDDQVL